MLEKESQNTLSSRQLLRQAPTRSMFCPRWTIFLLYSVLTFFFASCDEQKDDEVHPLRVSLQQQIPIHILTRLPDGSYDYKGSSASLFKWLSAKLGRPLVLVVPSEEDQKKSASFIKASFIKAVNGEVDISAMGLNIDVEQSKIADFTFPVTLSNLRMIVPVGEEESRLFAFLRPFQPHVWLFFLISLIGLLLTATSISWLYVQMD